MAISYKPQRKPTDDIEDEVTQLARARIAQAPRSPAPAGKAALPVAPVKGPQQAPTDKTAMPTVPGKGPPRLGASNGPQRGDGPTRQPTTATPPADELDDLARERQAAKDEFAAGKAQALQGASARAGAGGFGLSGATAALQGDIGRTQDRGAVLGMADFDRGQRDEAFQQMQRDAALADLEEEYEADINGDGRIGGFGGGDGSAGSGTGGRIVQGANQGDAEYVAAVLQDEAGQRAMLYPDALERPESGDNGRPVASTDDFVFYKDFETGVVFKVRR